MNWDLIIALAMAAVGFVVSAALIIREERREAREREWSTF